MTNPRALMAASDDVVERSMSINSRLPAQLEKALERNIVLRIGWTTNGEPVPKNGELGLCPNLPEGSRIRSLGNLGPFTAAFGKGGNFTHQGNCGSFLGAGNDGNTITCEREAGSNVGHGQKSGRITVLDGVGNDAGAHMSGGVLIIRGDAGSRIGGAMSGGDIIVHGDVGPDPGAGMSGGRIIINGRCPAPPPGVILRPLEKKDADEINNLLGDADLQVPADAVCLIADGKPIDGMMSPCPDDFSGISIVADSDNHNPQYSTCDTVTLIGGSKDGENSLALPIPLMPFVPEGIKDDIFHPCLVKENPREVDIVLIDSSNMVNAPELVIKSAGFAIDMDSLPHLDGAEIDGLLVALRTIGGTDSKVMLLSGIGSTNMLHSNSEHHGVDCAVSVIEDGSGIVAAATLPIVGRSANARLEGECKAVMMLPWAVNAEDLLILCASNVAFAICPVPDGKITEWIDQLSANLMTQLNRLGLSSIDSLSRTNLRACDQDTAAVSGLRLAGYDRPLPHWFAR